ncbi:MAG: hypothetical protein V3S20_06075, partial [Dehalococcoidia bacterium]
MEAIQSEMGGRYYISSAGKEVFQNRQARLGVTPDDTWGDGTNIAPVSEEYIFDERDFVSTVAVNATIFTAGQTGTELFRFSRGMATRPTADSLSLTAGEIWEGEVPYAGPATALDSPVQGEHWLANDSADGTGTDRSALLTVAFTHLGASANVKLTNTHSGTIYVTKMVGTGTPFPFAGQTARFVARKSVPGQLADRSIELAVPFAGDTQTTRDYAYAMLRRHRWPYPKIKQTYLWSHDDIVVAMAGAELGDLILYDNTALTTKSSSINDWFYIEAIKHTIVPGGLEKSVVTLLPSYIYRNLDKVIYDLFIRTDASGDLGSTTSNDTWADDSGFDIVSNKARPNATAEQHPNIDLASADMVGEVDLSNLSGDTDEEAGLNFRGGATVSSDTWRFYVDDGSNQYVLEYEVAGSITGIATAAWTPADTAQLRFTAQGNRIRCYDAHKLVIDETNATMNSNTKFGLYSKDTTVVLFSDPYAEAI